MEDDSERTVRAEGILGVATVVIILGSLIPWRTVVGIHTNALYSWSANAAFVGGITALFGTTVSYRLYRSALLQRYTPYTNAGLGLVGSVMALIGSFYYLLTLEPNSTPFVGLFLTMIGGFLGVASSVWVYKQEASPIPKGMSGRRLGIK